VAVAVSPAVTVEDFVAAASMVNVAAIGVACDGIVDNRPMPNAATTASAMRLKLVDLLVIYFLSLVVFKTILNTAGEEKASPRDAMHVLLHHILRRVSGRGEENC
jgi:hypothetical protein